MDNTILEIRTAIEEEANEVVIRIIDKIKHKYKAELRG